MMGQRSYDDKTLKRAVEAVRLYGSQKDAADALDINRATFRGIIQAAKVKGLWDESLSISRSEKILAANLPDGHDLKGVSTLVDQDGNVKLQWVKTAQDRDEQEARMREAIEAACSGIKREKPVKAPKHTDEDLLNQFTLTDYHLGMYSWGDETGADWDMQIAEDLLYRWFEQAIRSAPRAHTAILAQLGDFLHTDGFIPATPASGHVLDADTRYPKMVRVAIRALRRIIRRLLETHSHVHIIMADDNHAPTGSIWLREILPPLYENEPRISVDSSPRTYYCYVWGDTALFYHHGHKKTPDKVDSVFVGNFRREFGQAKYCYGHLGHLHHNRTLETNLMLVEQHRTLAAPDAYAARTGYLSGRSASAITYHKKYGEVGRVVISPEML